MVAKSETSVGIASVCQIIVEGDDGKLYAVKVDDEDAETMVILSLGAMIADQGKLYPLPDKFVKTGSIVMDNEHG